MTRAERVVVTGLGILAPGGKDPDSFWSSLVERRSGIGPITLFDASALKSRIAGEVVEFDPSDHIDAAEKPHRMARHTQMGLSAALMALRDCGLSTNPEVLNPETQIPVVIGVSTTAFDIVNRGLEMIIKRGPTHATPFVVTEAPPQAIASSIAMKLKRRAEAITLSTACASGLDAIAHAYHLVRSGKTDMAVAGGVDCPIQIVPFANLSAAGLSSTRNDEPHRASRPFDRDRDTGVVSEGCGIVVLENYEHALARGARIYMEILGCGTCLDPSLDRHAHGLKQSMLNALANSGRRTEDIDFISAHGPGHPELDRVETAMIREVFRQRAYRIPVSSIKGVTGNPLAAAGGIQTVAAALTLYRQTVPPTTNCEHPDPECDLDYVQEGPRPQRIGTMMVNTHGVGGGNSTIVFGAPPGRGPS